MKLHFLLLSFSFILLNSSIAQSRFAFEVKVSKCNTNNSGQLVGDYGYFKFDSEKDLIASNQSLGLIYKVNERNLLKLHLGAHRNGSIISATICNDMWNAGCTSYNDVKLVYEYLQFAPSYSYRILNKRIIIPIEAGININMLVSEPYTFSLDITKFNFDYEFSTGLDFRLEPAFVIGLHGIYTASLNEYQDKDAYFTYKPKQLGLELSILFEIGETQGAED